jgi:REP element-mobilizing transposase RayT
MKTWRGHNREWNIHSSPDRLKYLDLLQKELMKSNNAVHAIVLMANHVHEIFSIRNPVEFSRMMRNHHSRYGRYFNDRCGRCGKVAQDRPHTTLIQDENHAMTATFYLLANPLRANLCRDLRSYPFSTFRFYAFGQKHPAMPFIEYPEWYLALGRTPKERQQIFRNLFFNYLRAKGLAPTGYSRVPFLGDPLWVFGRRQETKAKPIVPRTNSPP